MLSIEQKKIIDEQISKENASEFVKTLIYRYGNTVEAIGELLNYIPKLTETQLKIKEKQIGQYSVATNLMMGDRYKHPIKYKKEQEHIRFITLFYTCKVHFCNVNVESGSLAEKAFFDEFVGILKGKKGFDYTSKEDWEWIYTTAGGADWLESVIVQNIDEKFAKPQRRKNWKENAWNYFQSNQ